MEKHHFDHIVIDEAGQATEPELLVPLLFVSRSKGTRVTLAGDHKQLGPILRSKLCDALGYNKSTLARLLLHQEVAQRYSVQLTDYRAHPSILRLYNDTTSQRDHITGY